MRPVLSHGWAETTLAVRRFPRCARVSGPRPTSDRRSSKLRFALFHGDLRSRPGGVGRPAPSADPRRALRWGGAAQPAVNNGPQTAYAENGHQWPYRSNVQHHQHVGGTPVIRRCMANCLCAGSLGIELSQGHCVGSLGNAPSLVRRYAKA